jgi:uncharacterized protein (DUF2062 family)
LRDQARRILHLNEPPHRTALAFSVGAFIAFSPTYGLHTVSVFVLAWAFRLNVAAVLTGSLINNPWTVVPILSLTMWTGFLCLGFPHTPPLAWHDLSLKAVYEQIMPYAAPFVVGGLVLGTGAALLGYGAAYIVIARYRRRRRSAAPHDPLPPPSG